MTKNNLSCHCIIIVIENWQNLANVCSKNENLVAERLIVANNFLKMDEDMQLVKNRNGEQQ